MSAVFVCGVVCVVVFALFVLSLLVWLLLLVVIGMVCCLEKRKHDKDMYCCWSGLFV